MKKLYLAEVNKEIIKSKDKPNEVLTEKDISHLPTLVQNYFRYCGYIGKEKLNNALVEWEDVYLKMSPKKDWIPLKCYQFNSVTEPTRIVYMTSKMFGIFPFEGRDKYHEGHGNMRIKLLKMFTVADGKGKEMDEAALVTVLAEALFVPGYALQDYLTWTAIDDTSVKGTISFNNTEVSGVFYFNDRGEYSRFETFDRHYSENGKEYKNVKWTGICGEHKEKNGIKYISSFSGVWNLEEHDFEYFKGKVTNITYNVKENIK